MANSSLPEPPNFPEIPVRCKSPKCCNKLSAKDRGLICPLTYKYEPTRNNKYLLINQQEPFNAEPLAPALLETFTTPEDNFFKCSHGPIPTIKDILLYELKVTGLVPKELSLSLDDIRAFPKHEIPITLQCAGNRRTEMCKEKKMMEVPWGTAAISTAVWGGARLALVLQRAGIRYSSTKSVGGGRHAEFISVDFIKELSSGEPFKASVPLLHATTPNADILLAYEMNHKELSREHGYPLRVIVPGCIGARSVKWVKEVHISADECQGFYMQKHFKQFPPDLDIDPPWVTAVDWSTRRPLMEFPVQSVICIPHEGIFLSKGTKVVIRGYAVAGGGRPIERVDVSINGGRSWVEANRRQASFPLPLVPCPCCGTVPPPVINPDPFAADGNTPSLKDPQLLRWAWVFWEVVSIVSPPTDIVVKAVDIAGNVQPQSLQHIWNFRGVNNNAWHKLHVNLTPVGKEKEKACSCKCHQKKTVDTCL